MDVIRPGLSALAAGSWERTAGVAVVDARVSGAPRRAEPAATGAGGPSVERPEVVDRTTLEELIEKVQERLEGAVRHRLEIHVDEELDRVIVQVLDAETGQVIRQVPPEAWVQAARQLVRLLGLLFDQRM